MNQQIAVVFDSNCVLCAGWVHFLLRHERHDRMVFISAWCPIGAAMAAKHGMVQTDFDHTFLVDIDGKGLIKSAAGLALVRQLRWPWRAATFLWLIPRPLRDAVYSHVAKRRYKWFGQRDACFLPPNGAAHRFISASSKTK